MFVCVLVVLMNKFKHRVRKGFDDVKDLVRGTIVADLGEFKEAYEHFKRMEGVEIVAIKEKLDKLQNVTINFVYQKSFIAEMQFRYKDHPSNYHGNHFLYEIERSSAHIEILESLNKKGVFMSTHNQLCISDSPKSAPSMDTSKSTNNPKVNEAIEPLLSNESLKDMD